jgi:hypothetical protein
VATLTGPVSDPAAVQKLTKMLDRVSYTEPYTLESFGHFTLKRADGATFTVAILPGQDGGPFGYCYGAARVPPHQQVGLP